MKTLHRIGIVLLLAALFHVSGCFNNSAAPAKVTGTITLDGNPVVDAVVRFTPSDGSRFSSGTTDNVGQYRLLFSPALDGAVVGYHKVTIETGSDGVPETIPKKYNSASELTATVKAGKNTVNFDLTSK